MMKRYLETGQIVGTHGLKGEVRVNPWCDSPDFLTQFDGFFFLKDNKYEYKKVLSAKLNKTVGILQFEGCNDIDAAIKLIKSVIYIDRDWVKLPAGSYFEQDLIGLEVIDAETGRDYGKLSEVARTGANDIYCVSGNGKDVWIPAIEDVIHSVDTEGGRMLITPLKGLFDDEN